MIGAIIGDIVGSRFEFDNHKSKDFEFMVDGPKSEDAVVDYSYFTDDTVMSLALCRALLEPWTNPDQLSQAAIEAMRSIGKKYPDCGFGGRFEHWVWAHTPKPYRSFGNGAAMRVSGCAWVGQTLEEVKALSEAVTKVTHNHPEGLKGAEATAVAVYLARIGKSKDEIRKYILDHYYKIDFTLDEIRPIYNFKVSCQGSVPQAMQAFFESTNFEDAIRNAISIGGDSDTLGATTGAVAEAYYGVPDRIREKALTFLDDFLVKILNEFETEYPGKRAEE